MWRSWRVWGWALALVASGFSMTEAASAAGLAAKSEGPGDPAREVIVLLAQGKGIPSAEEVVETLEKEGSIPAAWGLGAPDGARFVIPEADRQRVADPDPESPSGLLLRYFVLSYPLPADRELVLNALESNGDVLYAGDNPQFGLSTSPNDPLFPVAGTPAQHQWGSHLLHLPDAWDYNRGHAYVGVIDIGTAVQHLDLRTFHKDGSNQWVFDKGSYRPQFAYDYGYGSSEPANCPSDPNASPNCVDEGQPQTVANFSCPSQGCSVDVAGHGTHVSGIVAATANNSTGVAGVCWGCSLITSKVSTLANFGPTAGIANAGGGTMALSSAGVNGAILKGAQVLNLSFGYSSAPNCMPGFGNPYCPVMQLAADRDVLIVAAAGNDSTSTPDWPARDSRVLGVAGLDTGGALWSDCTFGQTECGSNYSATQINAPAKEILSTFYPTIGYIDYVPNSTCLGGSQFGLCTGTSMASPYIAGSAALLRSVNPLLTQANVRSLLTSNLDNPPGWNPAHGFGKPNVGAAVRAALGPVNGAVLPNRLTPLFSFYSSVAQDSFYTSVPQMATVAVLDGAAYLPTGALTPGYSAFPGAACPGGCAPKASVYVFTGERAPFTGAAALLPLYRMSRTWTVGGGNPNNRDTAYVTSDADVLTLKTAGYELDGTEGYIHPPCTGSGCSGPAGSVPLRRRYHSTRLDYAIFPDSELAAMVTLGYTSNGAFATDLLGYVYANADTDGDNVINGFEALAGTDPARGDSDCDGLSDGAEMLGYPASDPLGSLGCLPVAKFKFNCTGLSCSFDGSASTDNIGVVNYAWTFGDSGTASGAPSTTSHSYGATGTYVATLTVTDGSGLTGTLSRKLNVTSAAAAPAEGYFTVDPCRVLDTRNTTILTSSVSRTVQVTGLCNIPATAKAVSATITSVTPNGPGFLLVQPGNLPAFPYADVSSTLNFDPSFPVRANNAIARLATDGSGTLDARALVAPPTGTGQVHLIVDVTGYFSEDTSAPSGTQGPFGFQTITPCRLFDTRASTPLSGGVPRNFAVQGLCGIPSGAAAAAVNLAAISPSSGGFLTLYPSNIGSPPLVSNANFIAGVSLVTSNGARLPLAPLTPPATQDITAVFGSGGGATVHLVLDAQGYFTSSAPLHYHPITSCRVADTRFADLGAPALAGGEVREFQIRGNCGIPASAKAAAVNLVAVGPTGGGYLAAWAAGTTYPGTSNLNYDTVQGTVGNGAIVPLGTGGNELSIVAGGTGVHVIVDVFGYFD